MKKELISQRDLTYGGSTTVTTVIDVMWINVTEAQDDDERDGVLDASAAAAAAGIHQCCDVTTELNYSDIIPRVEEDKERWGEVCDGHGKRDDLIIFTTTMFTEVCKRCYLYWLQHQERTHLWYLQL